NGGTEALEVIAQYDPNGLKPRVLKMSTPARAGQLVMKKPPAGKKPSEEDGNLDNSVTKEVSLKAVFEAVRDDLKRGSESRPRSEVYGTATDASANGDPAPVTSDLVASRFADLSTEAMLRSFVGQHLGGDSRKHMLVLSGHGAGVSGDFLTDED